MDEGHKRGDGNCRRNSRGAPSRYGRRFDRRAAR